MPALLETFRQLIDDQNIAELNTFLLENPDLDLNQITPNRLSALWWAINPPEGKTTSEAIVDILIATNLIDPTQRYRDTSLLGALTQERIHTKISRYEGQYQHQNKIPQTQALATVAADAQNTHDSRIVKAVDKSVAKLYQRYGQAALSWNDDMIKCLESMKDHKNYTSAKAAIARIKKMHNPRSYQLEDKTVGLTNTHVLMLLWCALCDPQPGSFVPRISMDTAEIHARKTRLFEHLAQSENEYKNETTGQTSVACWMGTRNQMVSSLDATHLDVQIAEESELNSEILLFKYNAACKIFLLTLEREHPTLFRDFIAQDILTPINGDAFFPENKRLDAKLNAFLEEFSVSIEEENKSLAENKQMTPEAIKTCLAGFKTPNDSGVDHVTIDYQQIASIKRMERMAYLIKKKAPIFINIEPFQLRLRHYLNDPSQKLDVLTHELEKICCYFNTSEMFQWLQKNTDYQTFFNTLTDEETLSWISKHSVRLLSEILNQDDMPPKPISKTLWAILGKQFKIKLPQLAPWFLKLPELKQAEFLQELLKKKWHTQYDTIDISTKIQSHAFDFSLKTGYLNQLPIHQPIAFKNRDFRGIDLSTLDLKNIKFEQCDLRLTSILMNPSLRADHMAISSIDSDTLLHSIFSRRYPHFKRNAALLNALLQNPHSAESLLNHRSMGSFENALHWATNQNSVQIVKAILASPACNAKFLCEKAYTTGDTALIIAARSDEIEILKVILASPHCQAMLLNKTNLRGETALSCAKNSKKENSRLISLLIQLHTVDEKNKEKSELERARALLKNYVPMAINSFFFGKDHRNHIPEVKAILNALDRGQIPTLSELIEHLDRLVVNPNDFLDAPIQFIKAIHDAQEQKTQNIAGEHESPLPHP